MKHKHRDLIIAWADGATIEYKTPIGVWHVHNNPSWSNDTEYRVTPKPNKELLVRVDFDLTGEKIAFSGYHASINMGITPNVKFTFDGETGEFLKVEKI